MRVKLVAEGKNDKPKDLVVSRGGEGQKQETRILV